MQSLPPREAFRQLVVPHLKTLLTPNRDFIPVLLHEGRSLDRVERAKIVALTNRHQAAWDAVIDSLHCCGDWAIPTKLDRLFLFGTLNRTTQWYRVITGIRIELLADQTVSSLLPTAPNKRNK